jgi:hypothetical protein
LNQITKMTDVRMSIADQKVKKTLSLLIFNGNEFNKKKYNFFFCYSFQKNEFEIEKDASGKAVIFKCEK